MNIRKAAAALQVAKPFLPAEGMRLLREKAKAATQRIKGVGGALQDLGTVQGQEHLQLIGPDRAPFHASLAKYGGQHHAPLRKQATRFVEEHHPHFTADDHRLASDHFADLMNGYHGPGQQQTPEDRHYSGYLAHAHDQASGRKARQELPQRVRDFEAAYNPQTDDPLAEKFESSPKIQALRQRQKDEEDYAERGRMIARIHSPMAREPGWGQTLDEHGWPIPIN
jgi:hypothetical protein